MYSSKSMSSLQSNYRKLFQSVVICKSENRCGIKNENRVAYLLRDYLNNVQREERLVEDREDSLQKLLQIPYSEKNDNSIFTSTETLLPPESSTPALTQCSSTCVESEKKSKMKDTFDTTPAGLLEDTNFRRKNTDDTMKEDLQKNDVLLPNGCLENRKKTIVKANNTADEDCLISTERPHRCSSCEMAFKRKMHLERHFLVAHSEKKSHVCKICGKLFSRKDYLDKHKAGHLKRNFKLQLLKEGVVVRTKMHTKKNASSNSSNS